MNKSKAASSSTPLPAALSSDITLNAGATGQSSAAFMTQIEGAQSPNRQGYDACTLQEVMAECNVPGISIAVIKDYEIHWAKGYGVADVESGVAVDTDTLFQAASISKPVTAMAVLKAVQNGHISLDADVNTILESWKIPPSAYTESGPVTLRSLLSHTSGADDGFGFPGYDPSQPTPTVIQILTGEKPSNVGPVLFKRPPFAAFKYSGGGLTIVQLALTEALEMPFEHMMREYVLDPLGMNHSTFEQPLSTERRVRASKAHSNQGLSMEAEWHVYPEMAAAGLWTRPTDLARFVIEVQKAVRGPFGRVLSQRMAREMITPVGVGPFAVGLRVDKKGEGWYLEHSGGNWGFVCDLLAHFAKGYGVVVMTNSDGGGPVIHEVKARVAAAYNWDSLDKPVPR